MRLFYFLCVINWVFSEQDQDYNEKVERFGKKIGTPKIFFDGDHNLVLLVTVYDGQTNRVIDSGLCSVGIQLKNLDNINVVEELKKYLSGVLQVPEKHFYVLPGEKPFQKTVKIHGVFLKHEDVVDRLVAAMETTAKEEPEALKREYPHNIHEKDIASKEPDNEDDKTREFDWTDRKFDNDDKDVEGKEPDNEDDKTREFDWTDRKFE